MKQSNCQKKITETAAGRSLKERPAAKIHSGDMAATAKNLLRAIRFVSPGGYYFLFLPLGNPHVDTTSLDALA